MMAVTSEIVFFVHTFLYRLILHLAAHDLVLVTTQVDQVILLPLKACFILRQPEILQHSTEKGENDSALFTLDAV